MASQVTCNPAYPGFPAPPLKALAYRNGSVIDYDLHKDEGKMTLLLFCPVDFDYISPTEVRVAEELAPPLEVQVVLVSPGPVNSKAVWASIPRHQGGLEGTGLTLVGDVDRSISRSYGMLNQRTGHNWRGIVMVGPDRIITYRALTDLPLGLGVSAALRHVEAVRAGITPPDWRPGQDTQGDTGTGGPFNAGFATTDPLDTTTHVTSEEDGDMGEDGGEGNRQEGEKGAAANLLDTAGQEAGVVAPQLVSSEPGDGGGADQPAGGGGEHVEGGDTAPGAGEAGGEATADIPADAS